MEKTKQKQSKGAKAQPKNAKAPAKNAKSQNKSAKAPARERAQSNKAPQRDNRSELESFFVEELRDIYGAERQLIKALPKMQKAASSQELQRSIEEHITVTEEQVSRLERVFELMEQKPRAKKCEGIEGLVTESQSVLEETEKGTMTRDVGLIVSQQKVEHYEIAAYGSLVTLARTLGQEEIANLLTQSLEEEKQADLMLTELAENQINQAAATEPEQDEEDEEEMEEDEEEVEEMEEEEEEEEEEK